MMWQLVRKVYKELWRNALVDLNGGWMEQGMWKHQEWQKKNLCEQAVKITSLGSFSGHPDGERKERQLSKKLARGHQLKTHRLSFL